MKNIIQLFILFLFCDICLAIESDVDIKVLRKNLKSKDKAVVYQATAYLAAYYRRNGELPKAERLLKNYQSPSGFDRMPPKEAIPFMRCLLETAHIRALNKDVPGSLKLLNWAEGRKRDYERAVGCLKYANILLDLNEPDRAEAYLRNVKKIVKLHYKEDTDTGAAIGQGSKVVDTSAAWRALQDQADYVAACVEELQMNKKFGATYGLYVKLRRLQRIVKRSRTPRYFNEAMKLCDEIIDTDPKSQFAVAAGYLKGQILFSNIPKKEGKEQKAAIKTAKECLEKFVRDDPQGLYRGEALMLLGKIALEKEWDAQAAEKYYSQAFAWFKVAREKRDSFALYAPISNDLKNQTKPTQKPTTLNKWNRTVYHDEDPLKLYNTASAPSWYISEQEKQCLYKLGFFKLLQGKFDEAKPIFMKVLERDSNISVLNAQGIPNIVFRLDAACKCKRMIFLPSELKKLSKKERLIISTGDLYYITSQFDEAQKIYNSVLQNVKSSATAKACALSGIANSLEMGKNNFKEALNCYNKILADKELRNTALEPRAMFHYAENIYSSANMKDAIKPFEECAKKYPKTEYGELSMFKLIAIAYFYNRRRGEVMYERYLSKYPNAKYKHNIDYMVKLMEKDRGATW